jgi:hypothetical protein
METLQLDSSKLALNSIKELNISTTQRLIRSGESIEHQQERMTPKSSRKEKLQ